jgi:uncharacterized membrane protein YeaQ/YmgE (transglycosylase-associated protein family)
MNIIAFLLIGLISGWIASQITEGHGMGVLGDIVIGIVGAFVGGFIFDIFGITAYGFGGAIATSVIGAVVFLFILGLFKRSGRSTIGKI